ncbi:MAG: DUF1684 domain-containing protein, partial [Bacteroidales bacterium]
MSLSPNIARFIAINIIIPSNLVLDFIYTASLVNEFLFPLMKIMNLMKILSCFFVFVLICSCRQQPRFSEEEYLKELEEWKKSRLERLKSESGWLNLAGLYWLEEGINTTGADSAKDIIFPEGAPEFCGEIVKEGDSIYFRFEQNNFIEINGEIQEDVRLIPDTEDNTSILETGNFRWYIIKREELFGIRLRDLEHPRIEELDHVPSFEPDLKWRKEASFIAFEEPDTLWVPTVIGIDEMNLVPGKLEFRHEGKKYELLPFKAGKGLFLIIGDKTSAIETYAAGRFMY